MNRISLIRERLEKTFNPTTLEIIDDSAQHQGHVGAQNGAGHYTVIIAAEVFKGKSRIATHRMIYAALDELIPDEIHALKIIAS
jgi:BolA protein